MSLGEAATGAWDAEASHLRAKHCLALQPRICHQGADCNQLPAPRERIPTCRVLSQSTKAVPAPKGLRSGAYKRTTRRTDQPESSTASVINTDYPLASSCQVHRGRV